MSQHHNPFLNFMVAIIVVVLLVSAASGQRVACGKKSGKSAHFYAIADTTMEIAYSELLNVTAYECSRRCRDQTVCQGYAYSKQLETCQLFQFDRESGPEFLVSSSDFHFYDTVDTNPSAMHYTGACKHHRCKNGAACRVDCSEQGYYCQCTDGYRGEFCDTAYVNEAQLVQTIYTDMTRAGEGFSFDNMHFLAMSMQQATDSGGSLVAPAQVVYRFNHDTEEYEHMQTLTGFGKAYMMSAFQLTGRQYLFICNYKDWTGTTATDSYLWVYDNSTDSFVVHQTIATRGCLNVPTLRASDGSFYMFISNYFAPNSYIQDSEVYKWYPRYERMVLVDSISTTGAFQSDLYEIDSIVYVAIPQFRDGSSWSKTSIIWKRSDSYDLYIGCYIDSDTRAMDGDYFSSSSMTVSMCISYCRVRGYPYVGLQASTHCFCGDEDFSEYGTADDCHSTCAGDSSSYCGGSWRNSVYNTEPSWTEVQVIADSEPGATEMNYYEHDGSHYLVMTRHLDGTNCDLDTEVYVWNAGLNEWEHHQTISFEEACPFGVEIMERNGEKFMFSENLRKYKTATDGLDYTVDCRVFRLVGTMWVDYTTLQGINVAGYKAFERDGEMYLFQGAGRDETSSLTNYSNCPNKLYKWV